jgi:HD-GYP domain-containing protein (c-di-GMP phosphodiesterase class II)
MKHISFPYTQFDNLVQMPTAFTICDHINGFNLSKTNNFFKNLNDYGKLKNIKYDIIYHNVLEHDIKSLYSHLNIKFSSELQNRLNLNKFLSYNIHPTINYKNFICSFNGSAHVSRKLLVSILQKFKYFNTEYCSKNFSYTPDILDGHLTENVADRDNFYRKFFIADDSKDFFQSIYTFDYTRFEHEKNIYNLKNRLTESFLHVVSETMATSYVPFVTEKFLYSVVTRGLFLAYAQPGWHDHVETYYGFRRYIKLFDYKFDTIQNPVERLVELMTMVGKFSKLSPAEWHDLYLIEQDTIKYNYDHYFSGNYLTQLKQYEN